MPVYEYQCAECGERTERLEGLGEDSSGERCGSCRIGMIKKVFSPFGTGPKGGSESCSPPGKSHFR